MADYIWEMKISKKKRNRWERSHNFSVHLINIYKLLVELSDISRIFLIAFVSSARGLIRDVWFNNNFFGSNVLSQGISVF